MSDAAWSDDRVSTLSRLWADGLSATQIARQLGGVTRNAVIGKAHRLGLSRGGAASRPSRPARISPPRIRRAKRPAPLMRPPVSARTCDVVVPPPSAAPGLVRDLTELTSHSCRWPIGDPKADDFSFCGLPAPGRYCAAHAQVSTRPGTAWRVDRDPVVRRALAGLI
jgi:GcrA cell cycle regulator